MGGGQEQEVCRVSADEVLEFEIPPDGTTLGIIAGVGTKVEDMKRTILTVAANGGVPKEVCGPMAFARHITWSKDGRRLFWTDRPKGPAYWDRNEIWSVSAEGGEPQPLGIALHQVFFTTFSPDGRRLIVQDMNAINELRVMKIAQPPKSVKEIR